MEKEKRNSFTNSLGFVLAAAGSAVGLGNIWRFPYLAAKDGGGLFLCVYLVLALTFGFTMLVTEVAIGRKTKQAALTAYGTLDKRFGWLGVFSSIIPFLIMTYYCVIGGWVVKYMIAFLTGQGGTADDDGFFTNFITSPAEPVIFMLIFLGVTAFVIYRGVNDGIEKLSRILMPILLVIIIGIAIFSLTLKNEGRTGLQGFKIFIVPDVTGMSAGEIIMIVVDAMGQLFFSISVAMGIMVTYGSYFKNEDNLVKSVSRIEFFDTAVAILAGIMILPAIYVFQGREGMSSKGPGLMFITLPKVFMELGFFGNILGAVFFIMVFFAALTSAMSILETIVSSLIDRFGMSRKKAVLCETAVCAVLGVIICFGYNFLYFEVKLPNGSTGQILDIFDYISNYLMMPIVAIGTCIFAGWFIKPKTIIDEAARNGEPFKRSKMVEIMLKFISPALLTILLLSSFGIFD